MHLHANRLFTDMQVAHSSVGQSYAVSAWELRRDYGRAMHELHGCCNATLD